MLNTQIKLIARDIPKGTPNHKETLLKVLKSIGEIDADFNGDNGTDYLWNQVDKELYNSNLDYVLALIASETDESKIVDIFFREWMRNSGGYYSHWRTEIITNNFNEVQFIAFAYCTND